MGCFHPESSFADAKRENSGGGGHFCFHWREVLFYLILFLKTGTKGIL